MIKHFCNKCGQHLENGEINRVSMNVRGYTAVGRPIECDYCTPCLIEIIGEDTYNDMVRKKAEHQERIEKRRAENAARKIAEDNPLD